ncbi:MAG: 2-oxo acid dehydrogenase subunit E2, partial [Nitrospinota bacterium]
MAIRVGMPSLGHTMEKGTVLRWLKREGETVEKGAPLFEVETDKVTVEVEAPASGILLKIVVGENEEQPIGATLAFIGTPGETIAPEEVQKVLEENKALAQKKPAEFAFSAPMPPRVAPSTPPPPVDTSRIKISPFARKLAEEHGIDISQLTGTGPGGRIVKEDVERAIAARTQAPPSPELTLRETIPLTGMRKRIAERMRQSWETTPRVTEVMEIDVTPLVEYRERMLPQWEQEYGVRVSLNDLLLKGVALALRRVPRLNAALQGNEIHVYQEIHIGNAVNLEDGLIVPVLRNVDQKPVGQIAQESKALAEKARTGKLRVEEITGGTFT